MHYNYSDKCIYNERTQYYSTLISTKVASDYISRVVLEDGHNIKLQI
uniref:Uncharacterized protein n=1 Tax=Anguilla anguilla TaxID=7936 RepID=A0A0E9PZT7_ANGAN